MFRKVGAPKKEKPGAPAPAPEPEPPAAAAPAGPASESESDSESDSGSSAADQAFPPQPAPKAAPFKAAPAPARAAAPAPAPVVGRTAEVSTQEERIAQEWAFQAAMSNDADREEHTHDPPPPEGTHLDRFGFICPLSESVSQSKEEAALELSRLTKWIEMGAGGDGSAFRTYFARNHEKVKERVRKGIPNQLRGSVWQLISGSRDLRLRNPGLYRTLLAGTTACEVDIIRDVSRTFPSHIHYCQRHGLGQRQLFEVLKAYALYDTEVGYVQGMAYIAAVFLMYMSEEESFWLLVALLKGVAGHEPLEGLFTPGLPLVQLCLYQLDGLLAHATPKLHAHLAKENCHPSMYATQWFITLFSYSLPFDVVLRIWDVAMLEGTKAIFRVALALLLTQADALTTLEFEELLPALRRAPSAGKAAADALLRVAMELKVSKKLEELKAAYEKEQKNAPGASGLLKEPLAQTPAAGQKEEKKSRWGRR